MGRAAGMVRIQQAAKLLAILLLATPLSTFAQSPDSVGRNREKRLVLVSLSDRQMAVLDHGVVIAMFPLAIGADSSPSPSGEFQVVSRVSNPTYYHPGRVILSCKDNPLGTRWIRRGKKDHGIHGTNAPKSVGHAASHGCIRLRNRDIEQLFTKLRGGDMVQIRRERDEQIAHLFGGDVEDVTAADATVSAAAGGQRVLRF
jgi:lipoprotein-anchoring transpeptidase ErfK/SrfK